MDHRSWLKSGEAPFVCALVSGEHNPVMKTRGLALPELERFRLQLDSSPVRWSVLEEDERVRCEF